MLALLPLLQRHFSQLLMIAKIIFTFIWDQSFTDEGNKSFFFLSGFSST